MQEQGDIVCRIRLGLKEAVGGDPLEGVGNLLMLFYRASHLLLILRMSKR